MAAERVRQFVNVGSYLGAATVRAYAMSQAPGVANAAQLDTMRYVVRYQGGYITLMWSEGDSRFEAMDA